MPLPGMINIEAHEYSKSGIKETEIPVSAEYQVILKINGNPFVSISCSAQDMETLAVGHLFAEGIVRSYEEIKQVDIDERNLEIDIELDMTDDVIDRMFKIRTIVSGCGQGQSEIAVKSPVTGFNDKYPEISASGLLSCMTDFLKSSRHHKLTRGVHSAALFDLQWNELVFYDEIGRHNAVDKIIGFAFKSGIPMNDKLIFSTGRLSSEIVSKSINVRVPAIVSKASPTSHSINLARESNLILIGKVSGSKFYIFNGKESIVE